ncbi:MAG TPA: thiamine pyrophosphate-binding protein, partial [Acidimicrobiia bacterium]|nr:thiamine pyrophosphate-binding protein [Acidimicrobiia bacterium]
LGRCLRAAGVARVFGDPIPGLPHVETGDPDVARLLADCDGRLGPGPGCALTHGTLRLSSRPGARPEPVKVTTADDVPVAVAAAARPAQIGSAASELPLELELDAPAPRAGPVTLTPERAGREPLEPVDGAVVVLAGPGVVRAGAIDGLRAFAATAGVGVANTWGAKGVFPWDSPHHMGTAGLQERDFELLGFGDAALVVATGIDPDESAPARFALAPVAAVTPEQLSPTLALHLRAPEASIPANLLYERLAAVAQPGYVDDKVPLHPARAVADIRAALPADGVVAAEPGPAGLWVARTFPTTEPRSVVVPATAAPGAAAATALVAALQGRPAIAVVTEPLDDATRAVTALADRLGLAFVLEIWGLFGGARRVEDHAAALESAFPAPGVTEVAVPVDAGDIRFLIGAAGAVVAWGGLSAF